MIPADLAQANTGRAPVNGAGTVANLPGSDRCEVSASDRISGAGRIFAALTQLGAMQVAVGLGTLVRNKAMAVYLKPVGFGEFTQLMAIAAPVYIVAQCGMAVGLSRNTAAADSPHRRQDHLQTANLLTTIVGLGSLIGFVPLILSSAGDTILPALGVQADLPRKLMLVFLLTLAPLEALRNNYLSFLQGILDIKGISARRSVAVAASSALAVPLIATLGVIGACAQAAVAALLLAVLLGRRCAKVGFKPLAFAWNSRTAKVLASFGAASVLVSFSQTSVDALIRARLIAVAGMGENGLYQAALALSMQVSAVILGSVGTYSLAALSQTTDAATLQARVDGLLRVVLPVSTIGLGAVGLLSQPLFSVLFSSQFEAGTKYLPLLLAANYVQVACWSFGGPVLGRGLLRFWVGVQLTSIGLRYVTVMILLPTIGAYAIVTGVFLAALFDLLAYTAICRRHIGVRFNRATLLKFSAGGATVVFGAIVGSFGAHPTGYLIAAGLLCLTPIMIGLPEAQAAYQQLRNRYRRAK